MKILDCDIDEIKEKDKSMLWDWTVKLDMHYKHRAYVCDN